MPVRKVVNVPLSTDKGMCGGVNTQISKLAVACTKVDAEGTLTQPRGQCMSNVGSTALSNHLECLQTQRRRQGSCVLAPRVPILSKGSFLTLWMGF